MKMKLKHIGIGLGVVVALAALFLGGGHMGFYETPEYTVERKAGPIEIRAYPALLVAEYESTGTRKEGVGAGFRALADFIFGNNAPRAKVAMTTPVVQEEGGRTISMTTPVVQEGAGNSWKIRFVMPKDYTVDTLPKPNNTAVKVHEMPAQRVVAIRFSWLANDANIAKHEVLLRDFVAKEGLKTKGSVRYAYYDPPWTLPFFRRNEVLLTLE